MSEQLLTILKFGLLALVYLFFFRVLRAVWAEIDPKRLAATRSALAAPAAAPSSSRRRDRRAPRPNVSDGPRHLVVVEPADLRGVTYPMTDGTTIGRAATCSIPLGDSFVSQVHVRLHRRNGSIEVEDLGSTNGTYLNRKRLTGTARLDLGDRLQLGNTVLELR